MIINFLLELFGNVFLSTGHSTTLNTRKIDKNINTLNEYPWFRNIYEDEKYRRLFFANRHVRAYLQSTIRVKKIIRNEKAQQRFIRFLNKYSK